MIDEMQTLPAQVLSTLIYLSLLARSLCPPLFLLRPFLSSLTTPPFAAPESRTSPKPHSTQSSNNNKKTMARSRVLAAAAFALLAVAAAFLFASAGPASAELLAPRRALLQGGTGLGSARARNREQCFPRPREVRRLGR